MKKHTIALGMVGLLSCFGSQADTLLGVYAGAQAWYMDTSGQFNDHGDTEPSDFNFSDHTNGSFYIALEHPIPLIPNIKIQRTVLDTTGSTNSSFSFDDKTFSDALIDTQLTTTDTILYYELFDNDLISFDVGINGKYVDGEIVVTDSDNASYSADVSFSGVVPMLYSRLAVGLPLTGFGAYIEGSYLSFDHQTLGDYQAAVTYSLMDNLAVDLTLQVGYRAMELKLDDLDGIDTNLQFKGPFAGLEVHF